MKKIIRKSDIYSLEKVNERIEYYTKSIENMLQKPNHQASIDIEKNLLKFWKNYKLKNYAESCN